jgi:hypothetical protein
MQELMRVTEPIAKRPRAVAPLREWRPRPSVSKREACSLTRDHAAVEMPRRVAENWHDDGKAEKEGE